MARGQPHDESRRAADGVADDCCGEFLAHPILDRPVPPHGFLICGCGSAECLARWGVAVSQFHGFLICGGG
ncbi:MAG: hypothetical protein NZS48_15300 [Gemmata sp.]|nr:hypothetical protein [Gemmata sp.]